MTSSFKYVLFRLFILNLLSQVKEMMKQADKDGDGLVSFEEFKDIMCSKS